MRRLGGPIAPSPVSRIKKLGSTTGIVSAGGIREH